ncbi:hypothetical protein SNEBB_000668 [Seison nebaliae]|nr:hypothetical protein SNEBB_000668 [Seison nebaliae]
MIYDNCLFRLWDWQVLCEMDNLLISSTIQYEKRKNVETFLRDIEKELTRTNKMTKIHYTISSILNRVLDEIKRENVCRHCRELLEDFLETDENERKLSFNGFMKKLLMRHETSLFHYNLSTMEMVKTLLHVYKHQKKVKDIAEYVLRKTARYRQQMENRSTLEHEQGELVYSCLAPHNLKCFLFELEQLYYIHHKQLDIDLPRRDTKFSQIIHWITSDELVANLVRNELEMVNNEEEIKELYELFLNFFSNDSFLITGDKETLKLYKEFFDFYKFDKLKLC